MQTSIVSLLVFVTALVLVIDNNDAITPGQIKAIVSRSKQIGGMIKGKFSEGEKRCWIKAYGRGVGKPLSMCKSGLELQNLLCYTKCSTAYTGEGPVCWQDCLSKAFKNNGAFCLKPKSYGRGTGHLSEKNCKNSEKKDCEKNGFLWYPKCDTGFSSFGCCVCSPNCLGGQVDIGISCTKKTYGRGVGKPMICKPDQQEDVGLCYKKCDAGYTGIGPVCWNYCPKGWKPCGALCQEKSSCSDYLMSFIKPAAEFIKGVATDNPVDAGMALAEIGLNMVFPICS